VDDDRRRGINTDVVAANRLLAPECVSASSGTLAFATRSTTSAFSPRQSKSPELVTAEDIIEFDFIGEPVGPNKRPPYDERREFDLQS
jgi:hypothetical protein